jgi:flagellar biosynthesis chaperone FliJ
MRPTARTQGRRREPPGVGVSLFPFLAVLVCTMGALILLLVVIARQARLRAAQTASVEAAARDDDLRFQRELAAWRIEQLKTSLQKTQSQLADARLDLGHLEDHARRLRTQLAQLQGGLQDLNRLGGGDARQRSKLEAELEQVQAQVAEARRRLDEARRDAEARSRCYAVVPYRGPHETLRRPIYVECRAEAIVLQPEGIVLTEEDFAGPMGPGNPLAAALRAAREHLLAEGGIDLQQSGEPYPLLLVRPDGIAAYYAARSALKSWGSEFGYELIGEDWKLHFQAADSQLAQVMRGAIDTARVQQQQLAAAAPSHYGHPRSAVYRAAPTRGGAVPDGDPPGGGRSGYQGQRPSGRFADRFGSGGEAGQARASGSTGAGQEGPTHAGATLRPGEWRPSQPSAGEGPAGRKGGLHVESLAKRRGQDWGLPDAAGGSVPISRPIRIECHDDCLVIVPEKQPTRSRSVLLKPRTEESIDEFVSAIWEQMQSWGIAGNGMYWRPVLSVHVAPDAERRYAELEILLEGSGLSVERRQ